MQKRRGKGTCLARMSCGFPFLPSIREQELKKWKKLRKRKKEKDAAVFFAAIFSHGGINRIVRG